MVVLINAINNKVVEQKIKIYSDTYNVIKQKIILSYEDFISPETLAIKVKNVFLTKHNNVNVTDTDTIYIFNLIDELKDEILKDISEYIYIDENSIKNKYYSDLKRRYTDLSLSQLILAIKYILYKNIPEYFSNFKREIDEWVSEVDSYKKIISKKYLQKKSEYINENNIFLKDIDYKIRNASIITKLDIPEFDYQRIIKEITLNDFLPIVMMHNDKKDKDKKDIIKIYKKIKYRNISLDNIKFYGKNKIVMFVLHKGNYYRVLFDTTTLTIFSKIEADDKLLKFSDIKTFTDISDIVVNRLKNIFNSIKVLSSVIEDINCIFYTKSVVNTERITTYVKNNDTGYNNVDIRGKNRINLYNKKFDVNIIIKKLSRNNVIDKTIEYFNSVEIDNVSSEDKLNDIIINITSLMEKSIDTKVLKLKKGQFVEIEKEKSNIPLENIKKVVYLKKNNIELDTKGCQRKRQPILMKESNSRNIKTLKYKNINFGCDTDDYPYPGFTNKNIVCCFKKDQSDKEIFKKNILEIKNNEIPEKSIINTVPIKTEKNLNLGRYGILHKGLYQIFSNIFYRINVSINKTMFIDTINFSLGTNFSLNTNYSTKKSSDINNREIVRDNIIEKISNTTRTNIVLFYYKGNELFIKCNYSEYFLYKKFIFILYTGSSYELIGSKNKTDKEFKKYFNRTDPCVKKFMAIYKNSCKTKYSNSYNVSPLDINIVVDNNIEILGQVINSFGNTVSILTEYGNLPIIPCKKVKNVKVLDKISKLTEVEQFNLLKKSDIESIQPIASILDDSLRTIGILIKCGLYIPVKPSGNTLPLPVVYIQYVENIDEILFRNKETINDYTLKLRFFKELYERFRFTLSSMDKDIRQSIVKGDIKENIKKILDEEVIFVDKLSPIIIPSKRNVCSKSKTSDPFCVNNKLAIEEYIYKNFINRLASEILVDKTIIKGDIKSEFIVDDTYVNRDNELVIQNNEIERFIKSSNKLRFSRSK